MSFQAGELVIAIRADLARLTAGLKGGEVQVGTFVGRIMKAEEGLRRFGVVGTTVGASVATAMAAAIGTFAEFEQQIANTASVVGAVGEEMDRLEAAARRAGVTTIFKASEAAEAMYYLASAGLDTQEIIQSLEGTLALAAATMYDLSDTTFIVVSALKQWRMDASEAIRVANVMAASISGSQATMSKLGESLKYVGPLAASLNYSFEQTVATLSLLYNAGIGASQAGTALRQSLVRLQKPTGQGIAAARELGLAIDTDLSPQVNDLIGILRNLEKVLGNDKDAIREAGDEMAHIFGIRAVTAFQVLLMAGSEALEEMQKKITDTNKAFTMMEIQLDTIKGSWRLLKSAMQEIAIQMSESLYPVIRGVVDGLVVLARWFAALPKWIKGVVAIIGALTAVLGTLGGVLAMVLSQFAILITLGGSLGMVFTPLLIILGSVLAVVGAVVIALMNMGKAFKSVSEEARNVRTDTEAYKEAMIDLEKVLTRYNELQEKVNNEEELTIDQRRELLMIQDRLASQFPEAISGYDQVGRAVEFNTEKIEELVAAQLELYEGRRKIIALDVAEELSKELKQHRGISETMAEINERFGMHLRIRDNWERGGFSQKVEHEDRVLGRMNERLGRTEERLSKSNEELYELARALRDVEPEAGWTAEALLELIPDTTLADVLYLIRLMDTLTEKIREPFSDEDFVGESRYKDAMADMELWLDSTTEGMRASADEKLKIFEQYIDRIVDLERLSGEDQIDMEKRRSELIQSIWNEETRRQQELAEIRTDAIESSYDRQLQSIRDSYRERFYEAADDAEKIKALEEAMTREITDLYIEHMEQMSAEREKDARERQDLLDAQVDSEFEMWQYRVDAMRDGLNKSLMELELYLAEERREREGNEEALRLLEEEGINKRRDLYSAYYLSVANDASDNVETQVQMLENLLANEEMVFEQRQALELALEELRARLSRKRQEREEEEAEKSMQEAQRMFNAYVQLAEGIAHSFDDVWEGGADNMKEFLKNILITFLEFIKQYYIMLKAYSLMKGTAIPATLPAELAKLAVLSGLIEIAKGAVASFQEGGMVRGSPAGQIVRVGENNTTEHIVPEEQMNNILYRMAAMGAMFGGGTGSSVGVDENKLSVLIGDRVAMAIAAVLGGRDEREKGHGKEPRAKTNLGTEPPARAYGSRAFVREQIMPELSLANSRLKG